MTFVARTQSEPAALAAAVKQQIWKIDSQLPVSKVKTMNEVAAASFAARRFNMLLLAIFAGLALVLAAVGIYGVMSYTVTQRTQEIGIRMALGARAGDVLSLIIKNGMVLTLLGVVLGLAGAFGLTRLLTTLLFGVKPTDTVTFITVSIVLIFVALLACYLPARRATRVDPLVALRYE
jgi:putative ABC transport system permease protein